MLENTNKILQSDLFNTWNLNEEEKNQLDNEGYYLIKPSTKFTDWNQKDIREIRIIIDQIINREGLSAGSEGKEEFTIKKKKKIEEGASRVGNLLNKHKVFSKIATLPILLNAASYIISSEIKLSSIIFREPEKSFTEQEIHIDWHARRNEKDPYKSVLGFFYLDNSNKDNGATILIPKSHKKLGYPCEYVNPLKKHPEEKYIEAEAGSLLIINANIWHKGGSNLNGKPRGMIAIEYRERNLKQLLNLKKYICKDVQNSFLDYEKFFFGLRENDEEQIEDSFGPGEEYKKWLAKNKQYLY